MAFKGLKAKLDEINEKSIDKLSERERAKESAFRQEMKHLNHKAKRRKEKKREKARKRALWLKEHPYVMWIYRISMFMIIGGITVFMILSGYKLYDQYQRTKVWEKADTTQLATLSPTDLYATDDQKASRTKYKAILSQIWDSNNYQFTDNVSQDLIDDLTKYYDKIGDTSDVKSTYDEVLTMWSVKQSIDSVFADSSKTLLADDVTVNSLIDTVNDNYDKLENYLADVKVTHNQAITYRDQLYVFGNETLTMSDIITNFSDKFDVNQSGTKITVKTSATTDDATSLSESFNNLKYSWPIVENAMKPIIEKGKDVLAKNTTDSANYQSYQLDQESKNNFAKYLKSYNDAQKSISGSVIDMPNYVGQKLTDAQSDAKSKGINVKQSSTVTTTDKTKDGLVATQAPTSQAYAKIVKGATIGVTVYKYEKPTYTSSSSSSKSSSSSYTDDSTDSTSSSSTTTESDDSSQTESND